VTTRNRPQSVGQRFGPPAHPPHIAAAESVGLTLSLLDHPLVGIDADHRFEQVTQDQGQGARPAPQVQKPSSAIQRQLVP